MDVLSTPIYRLVPTASRSRSFSESPIASLNSLPEYKSASAPASKPSFSGGGLTRRIYSSIQSGWTIPTGFLLIFALEGDNRADATLFAGAIAKIVVENGNIEGHTALLLPVSYQLTVFVRMEGTGKLEAGVIWTCTRSNTFRLTPRFSIFSISSISDILTVFLKA